MKDHKCPRCQNIYKDKDDLNYDKNNEINIWKWLAIIFIIIGIALTIGIWGYQKYNKQNWIDATYNATTVMTGAGATTMPQYDDAKIFASIYSLVVGILYAIIITVFVAIALTQTGIVLSR